MKESVGTSLSWIKANAFKLGILKRNAVLLSKKVSVDDAEDSSILHRERKASELYFK